MVRNGCNCKKLETGGLETIAESMEDGNGSPMYELKKLDRANFLDGNNGQIYEWIFDNPAVQNIIFTMSKGQKFGGYCHKGDDPSKNPEKLLLVAGKVKVTLEKFGKQRELIWEPQWELIIYPCVSHWFEALEDATVIEARSNKFDRKNSDISFVLL